MAMPSFAFSVHNFISSTGADAGFAAIVGLAILVLLYFAHARETANLREEAALLTQRLQHAEARVAQLSRLQAAEEARPDTAAPAVAIAPFAPAGTAAPALASATHVIPAQLQIPEPEEPIVVQRPAPAPAPALAMAGVAAPGVARPPGQAPPPPSPAPGAPAPTPAPGVPAPAPAPGVPAPAPARGVPAPATSAGGNGAARSTEGPPPAAGRRPAPARAYPPLEMPRKRRSRLGRGIVVATVALAAVAVAVVLFAVTAIGGSNTHTSSGQTTNPPRPGHTGGAAAFKPASITVAVLNGTSVNQLAHKVGAKLMALGYKEGTLATASNQTEAKTIVAYLPGSKNRVGAQHVATALGLHRSAVQPVDQGTLQVACPGPSTCTANVVVTVGADLSTL